MADLKPQTPVKSETELLKARIAELEEQLKAGEKPAAKRGAKVSGKYLVVKPCFRRGRLWRPGDVIVLEDEQVSKAMVPFEEHGSKPAPKAHIQGRPSDKTVA